MPERARIAVIGTGWWATYTHIPGLLEYPAAELVAIADRDPERLRIAATTYGIARAYEDYRAMLAQETLDGVIVATPHATHYAIARDCLARGIHVMVEKPLTLHATEARELVQLARARGRALLVGYPYNLKPQALRARGAEGGTARRGAIRQWHDEFADHRVAARRSRSRPRDRYAARARAWCGL